METRAPRAIGLLKLNPEYANWTSGVGEHLGTTLPLIALFEWDHIVVAAMKDERG
jgi:hypothetical protein